MPALLGSIDQLGYVVDDIQAAMRHWTEALGVGPFTYFPEAPIQELLYRGEPTAARIAVALSYVGDLQIELIQQITPGPSVYADFLGEHGPGLHHLCRFTNDYEEELAGFADRGYQPIQHGHAGPQARFAYFPTEAHGGTVIEVYEIVLTRAFFEGIADCVRTWDGRDPIRTIG